MDSVVRLEQGDPRFPERQRFATNLWTSGNLALLQLPAVGICGARDASDAGIRHSMEFGRIAVEAGFVVVTGYARGVDNAAQIGALDAKGTVIAVLPEGIAHFRVRRELKGLATPENFLAVSSFSPDTPWTVWNAMKRNKLIVGLAKALFVIEAGEKGGTLDAGLECLDQHRPLGVLQHDNASHAPPGNQILLRKGAIAIRTRRELKTMLGRLKEGSPVESSQTKLELA